MGRRGGKQDRSKIECPNCGARVWEPGDRYLYCQTCGTLGQESRNERYWWPKPDHAGTLAEAYKHRCREYQKLQNENNTLAAAVRELRDSAQASEETDWTMCPNWALKELFAFVEGDAKGGDA